jgi:parallel beta-helix repeat protein
VGDYEIHKLRVQPTDDLVSILNNIGDNTEVELAEGTHTIASQINLSGLSNVTIRGSKASILDITYSGDNPIAITAPAADISFEGFSVIYNGTAGGQTPLFAPIGSGGADIFRLSVCNIHADFNAGAITFVRWDNEDIDVYGITVENCALYGAQTKGLFRVQMAEGRELKQVQIIDNKMDRDTAGGSQGTAIYGASGSVVEDVVISGNTSKNIQESLWLQDDSGVIKDVVIDGNVYAYIDSGNAGCYIIGAGVTNVAISDNIFDATGASYNLTIASGSHFIVADNQFLNAPGDGLTIGSGVTDSTIDNNIATNCTDNGIEINGSDNRISNNVCEGNDYGIVEGSGADGNHYVGNTCRNNLTADKLLQGTGRRQGVNFW